MGRERSRITPAAEDARRQYGGSPASCHRRNLRTPRQLANERSSDISNASTAIRVMPSRSCTSRHQSAISSRSLLAACGTYSGNFAHVS